MVLIYENDLFTKGSTVKKMRQIQRESPKQFDKNMLSYMKTVYMETIHQMQLMGIRDTGALMASTRLEREGAPVGRFDISRGTTSGWKIVSGGGGVMNPKNKRVVDYAKAVHDGHATPNGGWVAGRPYLTTAWRKMGGTWKQHAMKYLDWVAKTWSEDQPSVNLNMWKLPLVVKTHIE